MDETKKAVNDHAGAESVLNAGLCGYVEKNMISEQDKLEYFRLHEWRERWKKLLRSNRYELQSNIEKIERRCRIANANIGAWLRRVHGDRLRF